MTKRKFYLIFKGKLLSLFKEKVRLPNGYIAKLEVIKHPGAALIVPFLTENKVIILKQFRPVIDSYLYELPAGTLEKGESPLLCAKRELREEVGYSAGKFTKLGEIYPVPGYSTEKIIIYKAEILKIKEGMARKDEVIKNYIVTRNQLKQFFKAGKIVDAKTICAFALCGWL
jgi:ADP-ribose pyrophosphatase